MTGYIVAAIFLAVLLGIGGIYLTLRRKLRLFSRDVFGTADILEALKDSAETDDHPRSLNGCDSLLLPQILKDFPDFDPNMAKSYARAHLKSSLTGAEPVIIHNIVLARYLRSAAQKTIVMQAALSCMENGSRVEKRYDLHYSFLINSSDPSVAANCPNCGGALGYGQNQCPYCGSRVANVLKNTWEFSEMTES